MYWIKLQVAPNTEGNTDAVEELFEHPVHRVDSLSRDIAIDLQGFVCVDC